jgi:hypothetical protein
VSNTTENKQVKKQQKRRFFLFTKILMRFLERRDPAVFNDARAVIHDCELKKKKGETESVVESIRSPLKVVVGPEYWKEARSYSQQVLQSQQQSIHRRPLSPSFDHVYSLPPVSPPGGLYPGHHSHSPVSVVLLRTKKKHVTSKEEKIRKKRLWMIICVLMKYLMRKDNELYLQAKNLVRECVHRHRNGEEGYTSLSGSIQTSLKNQIGHVIWKRAESCIAKFLLNNNNNGEERNPTLEEIEPALWTSDDSLWPSRKRPADQETVFLNSNTKRPRFHESSTRNTLTIL